MDRIVWVMLIAALGIGAFGITMSLREDDPCRAHNGTYDNNTGLCFKQGTTINP